MGLSLVRGFVDDVSLVATGPGEEVGLRLISGIDLLLQQVCPLGLAPNAAKHQLVASSEAARNQLAERFGVSAGTHAVDLGADFSVGPVDRGKQKLRLLEASRRASRVGRLPLSRLRRLQFVRAEVLAVGLYGAPTAGLSARTLHHLRAVCSRALLGTKREQKSRLARGVLLNAVGSLDPWVLGPLSILKTWARFFRYSPAPIDSVWARSLRSKGKAGVVTDHLYTALTRAGFRPGGNPRRWVSVKGFAYDPIHMAWVPEASASLRDAVWAQLAARRREFSGSHFPPPAVFAKLRAAHKAGRREEAGLRLLCLGGGTWAPTAAAQAGVVALATCPHCGAQDADVCHRWWVCPRWQSLRVLLGVEDLAQQAAREGFHPRSLWECGIPELPVGALVPAGPGHVDGPASLESLLFTDGSVLRSSDPAVARAGWAFSDGRGSGCFGALPGHAQTINRAELYAVLACASAHQRQLIICTDSSYVTRGATSVARGDWPATNGDLWEGFEALPVRPALLKVPAHLDPAEAALRGLPEVIRQGNADADSLARRGASAPVTPPGVDEQRAVLLALGQRVQDAQWR
ncbi:MAG: hypothetical protein GY772_22280, partial [bacterium]|nr:hypothetical protein [bacterium]